MRFDKVAPRDDKLQTVNLTPSNYGGSTEFLMPTLSKMIIPFHKVPSRKPLENNKSAVTNSIIYDNIEKYYYKNSKYHK